MPTAFKEGVCLPRRICYGQRSGIVLKRQIIILMTKSFSTVCNFGLISTRVNPGGVCRPPPPPILPIMAYTGRVRPKGVSFSGFRFKEGRGFHWLKNMNK